MWFDHFLNNFLNYFLLIATGWTTAIIARMKLERPKQLLLWGNTGLLVIILIVSFFTIPTTKPLQTEIAFYALREKHDDTYELYNLLGGEENPPEYLGIDSVKNLKGLPIVNSGDGIQIRLKLNQKGYLYIFHFDTVANKLRQLFPSSEISMINPLPANGWLELPSPDNVWTLDSKESLEAFIMIASTSECSGLQKRLNEFVERVKMGKIDRISMTKKLKQELTNLGYYLYVCSGELNHGLINTNPQLVKTRTFRGSKEKSILFWQFVQHK